MEGWGDEDNHIVMAGGGTNVMNLSIHNILLILLLYCLFFNLIWLFITFH